MPMFHLMPVTGLSAIIRMCGRFREWHKLPVMILSITTMGIIINQLRCRAGMTILRPGRCHSAICRYPAQKTMIH